MKQHTTSQNSATSAETMARVAQPGATVIWLKTMPRIIRHTTKPEMRAHVYTDLNLTSFAVSFILPSTWLFKIPLIMPSMMPGPCLGLDATAAAGGDAKARRGGA